MHFISYELFARFYFQLHVVYFKVKFLFKDIQIFHAICCQLAAKFTSCIA